MPIKRARLCREGAVPREQLSMKVNSFGDPQATVVC